MKWLKKTIRWILDTYEEADSIDPWRGDHASNPTGIRLFDLVALHLEDQGYYPRLYRSGNLLIIYKSRWARFWDKRVGAIAFEVSGPWGSRANIWYEEDSVWSFGFGKPWALHAGSSISSRDKPELVCNTTDPFALERISKAVDEFYLAN